MNHSLTDAKGRVPPWARIIPSGGALRRIPPMPASVAEFMRQPYAVRHAQLARSDAELRSSATAAPPPAHLPGQSTAAPVVNLSRPVAAIPLNPTPIHQPQPDQNKDNTMTSRETLAYLMSLPEQHIVDIGHGRRVPASQAVRMLLDNDPVVIHQPAQQPNWFQSDLGGGRVVPSEATTNNLSDAEYDALKDGAGIDGFMAPMQQRVYRRQSGTTHRSSFNLDKDGLSHAEGPSYGVEKGPDGQPRLNTEAAPRNPWGLLDGER